MNLKHIKVNNNEDLNCIKLRSGEIIITKVNDSYIGYYYIKIGEIDNNVTLELLSMKKCKESCIKDIKDKIINLSKAFNNIILNVFSYDDFKYNYKNIQDEYYAIKVNKILNDKIEITSHDNLIERLLKNKDMFFKANKNRYFEKLKVLYHTYLLIIDIRYNTFPKETVYDK